MKKVFFLISIFVIITTSVYSQNPLTVGGSNNSVEQVVLSNKTNIAFTVEKKVDVKLLKRVRGVSTGIKFVPILPFLPKHAPGVVNINARELEAERKALKDSGGDILLNKKVERTYTGFLLVLWFEKIEVTGIAAKIIK